MIKKKPENHVVLFQYQSYIPQRSHTTKPYHWLMIRYIKRATHNLHVHPYKVAVHMCMSMLSQITLLVSKLVHKIEACHYTHEGNAYVHTSQ